MLADMGALVLAASLIVVAMAGFVKGAVGFALPMILVSGLGSFMPAELVVAAVILPTMATNLVQGFRTGMRHAWASFHRHWRFAMIVFVTILASAQLLRVISDRALFLMLGVMIVVFTSMQLAGWKPVIRAGFERVTEISAALVAGFVGGLTGVWGPPTILYLTALDVPKAESVRVQGVMYLMGSVLLTLAHLKSGVLNAATIPYSALLILPAMAGQMIGLKVHDRMDQAFFRRATLVVLIIAGANLVRRGLSL